MASTEDTTPAAAPPTEAQTEIPAEPEQKPPTTTTIEVQCIFEATTQQLQLEIPSDPSSSPSQSLSSLKTTIESAFASSPSPIRFSDESSLLLFHETPSSFLCIENDEQLQPILRENPSTWIFRVIASPSRSQYEFDRLMVELDGCTKMKRLDVLDEELKNMDEQGDSPMEDVSTATSAAGSSRSHLPWGAGVGYGNPSDNSYWDMDSWQRSEREQFAKITTMLGTVNARLEANDIDLTIIFSSSLIPFLIDHVSTSSIPAMKRHEQFYKMLFQTILWLVKNETTRDIVNRDVNMTTKSKANLWRTFENLNRQASQAASLSSSALQDTDSDLIEEIIKCFTEASPIMGTTDESATEDSEMKEATKPSYEQSMEELRFDTVSGFTAQKFQSEVSGALTDKKLIRRLAGEYADIAISLPLNEESSIFVRVHETNMNLARFLVVPADETPYASGCFIFDVYFPGSYPDSPPKVNLATTGGGTVRFNPNLYNDGYVCLSLLGTWDAETQGEEWNPGVSTFLQVVISVQSLIFVPDPYWNEPGFESNASDPGEQENCAQYNKDKQKNTVIWGMIDLLLHPPTEFLKVILRHFYLSKERVLRNAVMWLGEDNDLAVKLRCILDQLDDSCMGDTPTVPTEPTPEQLEAMKKIISGAGDGDVEVTDEANAEKSEAPQPVEPEVVENQESDVDVVVEDAAGAAPPQEEQANASGGAEPMSVDPPQEE